MTAITCPKCEFPVDPARHPVCPKCETPLRSQPLLGLHEVDVVHSGEDWEAAARKIEEAVDHTLRWSHSGLKIIHGHGSTTGRSVIAPRAISLMRELAARHGGTFTRDRNNPGAHLIWFNH